MNQQLETTNRAEINPFRPEIPSEFRGLSIRLHDFLGETIESQYAQHNLAQAGDTTYSWELLTKVDVQRRFTLGATGRFYHATYGILQARYCQFVNMRETQWLGAPLGLKKSAALLWQVTNDIALSHSSLVIGIGGQYVAPPNESYGWVITNGPNIQSLPINATWAEFTRLGWAANDVAGADGVDSTFGSLMAAASGSSIPPGQFFVDSVQVSDRQLKALLAEQVSDVKTSISALTTRFDNFLANDFAGLNSRVDRNERAVSSLTQKISALDRKIVDEVAALNTRIQSITGAAGVSYVTTTEFTGYRGGIDSQLGVLGQRIAANQEDIARINAVITGIDAFEFESLVELANRVRSLTFLNLADTPLTYTGSENYLLRVNAGGTGIEFYDLAGSLTSYVTGPGPTQIDNGIPRWDGTGGYTLQGSGVTISDSDRITARSMTLTETTIGANVLALQYAPQTGTSNPALSVSNGTINTFEVQQNQTATQGHVQLRAPTGQGSGCKFKLESDVGGTTKTFEFQLDGAGNVNQVHSAGAFFISIFSNLNVRDSATNTTRFRVSASAVTCFVPLTVVDEAYSASGWDGNLTAPSKNAIRDKIEAMAIGVAGVTEHSGDSNTSYTWGTTKRVLLLSGTLTAGRTLTLNTSGAVEGAMVRIVRTGAGAFDWSIGTGPLKLLAANTWCDVTYNGSAWILAGYGTL